MFICIFSAICDNPAINPFPPSIVHSDWVREINKDNISNHLLFEMVRKEGWTFNTQSEMEEFINTHRLSDLDLIEDIKVWKEAHNIRYEYKYYSMTEININIEPLV